MQHSEQAYLIDSKYFLCLVFLFKIYSKEKVNLVGLHIQGVGVSHWVTYQPSKNIKYEKRLENDVRTDSQEDKDSPLGQKYLFLCLDGVPWGVLVEIQDPLLLLLLFVLFDPVELFRGVLSCKLYWLLFN